MTRIAVGMGLVLALAACGGKQAGGPAPTAPGSTPEPAVASPAATAPATTSVEAPVEPAASPPSDPPAGAATTVPSDSPAVDTSNDTTATPPPLGSGNGKTAAELSAEAQTAAKAAQWGRALSLAEQALRARPDSSTKLTATTTAALSACNLKNVAKAKQYLLQLPASRQAMIRQRCLANGVSVTP